MKTMKNKKALLALVMLGLLSAAAVPVAISAATAEGAQSGAGQIENGAGAGYWCPGAYGWQNGRGGCWGYGGEGYGQGGSAAEGSTNGTTTPQSYAW